MSELFEPVWLTIGTVNDKGDAARVVNSLTADLTFAYIQISPTLIDSGG